jgi:hypothetical protein
MMPIFFEADPYSLVKNNTHYSYYIFLFYDKNKDQRFRNSLRKDYPEFHEVTTNKACVFDFDFPPKVWLENYLNWFLTSYQGIELNAGQEKCSEYLKELGIDAYEFISEQYDNYGVGTSADKIKNNLKILYEINDSETPTILILDAKKNEKYAFKNNISIHSLHAIAKKIGGGIPLEEIPELRHSIRLSYISVDEILDALRKPFSNVIYDLKDSICSVHVKNEKSNIHISYLCEKYQEFRDLKFPERFHWKPSLERSIKKNQNYLRIFIEKINLLETHPDANSLDLKNIRDFSRFRLNDSFRALFYKNGVIKEFFAFGEHDLGL